MPKNVSTRIPGIVLGFTSIDHVQQNVMFYGRFSSVSSLALPYREMMPLLMPGFALTSMLLLV
jgi:hypothetical protein